MKRVTVTLYGVEWTWEIDDDPTGYDQIIDVDIVDEREWESQTDGRGRPDLDPIDWLENSLCYEDVHRAAIDAAFEDCDPDYEWKRSQEEQA